MVKLRESIRYWLNPRHWSSLSEGDLELSDNRKNIFFSQLCVLGGFFTILQSVDDFVELNPFLIPLDVVTIGIWPICYWLNERGSHLLAKTFAIVYLNFIFFLLSATLDASVKMELLFYPLIILTFMTLGSREKYIALGFGFLSLIFLVTLSLTNNQPFGAIHIQQPTKIQELLNILTAAFFTGACAIFIIELHTKAENSLRAKRDDLLKVNEELDRFVYISSHDMRAPLLSIKGLVTIALMEGDSKNASLEYLRMIQTRAQKLDDLIVDIANYSRNSRVGLDVCEVNLADLLNEAEEKIRFLDRFGTIMINKKVIGNPLLKTDGVRLNIVINNLLANAVKYHDFNKDEPFIDLVLDHQPNKLEIIVRDNGSGIDKKHQDKIFQMFYRATDQAEGSGLGLYIVKEVVSKLKGEILFTSEFRKGSEFKVIIPHPLGLK